MSFSHYLINSRKYSLYAPLPLELNLEEKKNYLFNLDYLSSLTVNGEQAAEFLQGQLSCDLRKVTDSSIQQGAMCNLKGRILALLDIIYWQQFQLILPHDLLVATQTTLNKVAMLSRVKLIPTTFQLYGLYLGNPDNLLPEGMILPTEKLGLSSTEDACCYKINDNMYLLLIKKEEQAASLSQSFIKYQQFRGSLAWHQLQLRHKTIQIYPETRGMFLPHRLDLHLSGYLSFDKGCYKGQEIIARTHYKAKLKHSLKLFLIETEETLLAGKKIFTPTGTTEMGELIDFCPLTRNQYLIAATLLHEHPCEIRIESHEQVISLLQV